jgi:hypothetical protein
MQQASERTVEGRLKFHLLFKALDSIQSSPNVFLLARTVPDFLSKLRSIWQNFFTKPVEFPLMVSLRAGYCLNISSTGTLSLPDLVQDILKSFRRKAAQNSGLST